MTASERAKLNALLEVDPRTRRSDVDRLKQPAKAATLSRCRKHLAFLTWADSLGASERWLDGVPPAKVAHFAGEARVLDAADLRKVGEEKLLGLLACLLHTARRGRDEVVGMFCKRMAAIHKRGRTQLEEIRERHRAELERLWEVFGDVLHGAREALGAEDDGDVPVSSEPDRDCYERAGRLMLEALDGAGGVERVSADHAAIAAHHGAISGCPARRQA